MSPRQMPRWSQLQDLIKLQRPDLSPTKRHLAGALTVADVRDVARRRVPRAVFDYVDGSAETEASYRRARAAYEIRLSLVGSEMCIRDSTHTHTQTHQ